MIERARFEDSLDRCAVAASARTPYAIGICGGSQAGKSTFAERLAECLDRLGVRALRLAMDDFFLTKSELEELEPGVALNFDRPAAVDLTSMAMQIADLRAGKSVPIVRYHFPDEAADGFPTARRIVEGERRLEADGVLIVEGLFVHHPPVREQLDYCCLIDGPEARVRRDRRVGRDVERRGYDRAVAEERWDQYVQRGYELHVCPPGAPERFGIDLIVENHYA